MAQLMRAAAAPAATLAWALVLASGARAACLRYEPAQVVLVGRLTPLPEAGALALRLDRPICVVAGSGAAAAEGVRTVRFSLRASRIAPDTHGWAGRRAAVSGSLFHDPHDRNGELSLLVTGLGRAR